MSDPYIWIDPFAEKARADRAERRIPEAREEGRQDVVRFIEREHGDELPKAIERAAHYLAERVAEDFLRPHLAKHRLEWEEYQRRRELEIEANMAVLRPAVAYATSEGAFHFALHERMATGERSAVASIHTTRPFQYHVTMSPSRRDRW